MGGERTGESVSTGFGKACACLHISAEKCVTKINSRDPGSGYQTGESLGSLLSAGLTPSGNALLMYGKSLVGGKGRNATTAGHKAAISGCYFWVPQNWLATDSGQRPQIQSQPSPDIISCSDPKGLSIPHLSPPLSPSSNLWFVPSYTNATDNCWQRPGNCSAAHICFAFVCL